MTTVSKNAAPVKTHRSKAKAEATRRGLLYALPDWLMIIMLFFVPIVLLVIMAGSRWSLMGGNRGWNFPENFVKVFENKLLGQSVLFTLEYTVIVTIFLLVLGLGLALIVQESTKWNNMLRTCFLLPSATGLASASLLFYALYSPQVGPVTKILSFFGLMDEAAPCSPPARARCGPPLL
ncbi:carbohydrate ABC transporter permease [Bifidobacterium pseudocatenulatum]|uniref:carbohydrate ABC transporter permease n=1 Tax=Bifidobacterium pseudocatenulatum TaxID=28026 RepID=UPI00356198B6